MCKEHHHHEEECCSCEHHHHEEEGQRGKLLKIVLAAILLAVAIYIEHTFALPTWQLLLVYLVPYLLVGGDTLKEAAEGLMEGEAFNEDFSK